MAIVLMIIGCALGVVTGLVAVFGFDASILHAMTLYMLTCFVTMTAALISAYVRSRDGEPIKAPV